MAANGQFDTLYGDAAKWDQPDPDYDAILTNHVGSNAGANRDACTRSLCNLSQRTPVVLAFVLRDGED